jgi:hypothetical protein
MRLPSASLTFWIPETFILRKLEAEASNLAQLLGAYLLDLGLPDLIRHPGRGALGLVHLHPRSFEEMHFLRAPLSEPDVFVAPVGRLQGCLAGRLSRKNADLVAVLVSQGEVSWFLFFLGYGNVSYTIYR